MAQHLLPVLGVLMRVSIFSLATASCCGCVGESGAKRLVESGGIVLVPGNRFESLTPGMTVAEVRQLFRCEGQHQFAMIRCDHRYLCLSYSPKVDESEDVNLTFYLVFRDEKLTKVVSKSWPALRTDGLGLGALDMVTRAEWIVQAAPRETAEQVKAAIVASSQTIHENRAANADAPNPAVAAMSIPMSLQVEEVARRNQRVSAQFAGSNLHLNMTPQQIEKLVGPDRKQETIGSNSHARFYWSDIETGNLKLKPEYVASGVVVIFEGDRATTILSRGFFAEPWYGSESHVATSSIATTRESPRMLWDAVDQPPLINKTP